MPGASWTASSARARRAFGSSPRWSTRTTPETSRARTSRPRSFADSSRSRSSTSHRPTVQSFPQVCIRLDGEDEAGLFERLRTVAASIGFSVEDADDLNGANGVCTHDEHRIQVLAGNSPAQRVKTLAHELGHAILHAPGEGRPDSRAVLELEAESVAFVVCAAAGITSDDYSFGYVATWSGGGDEALAAIKASGTRIQGAADQILNTLEDAELAEVA